MRRDRPDLSSARAMTGPLLAAGPWLRDVLRLNPRSRCGAADRGEAERMNWIRKSRKRQPPARRPIEAACDSEASVIIFHDGWYYLLVMDRACCAGANSSGDIRVGRSRKVTGPFVDNTGNEMFADEGERFVSVLQS